MRYVIYHRNCLDGFCAAWLLYKKYGFKSTEYLPLAHHEKLDFDDFDENDEIIMVDICLKSQEDNIILSKIVSDFKIYDHHITAKNVLDGLEFAHFDMEKSGCGIILSEFAPKITENQTKMVLNIQDRDLWKHELENTSEITAALQCYEKDFYVWDDLDYYTLIEEGKTILRYENQIIKHALRTVNSRNIGGYYVPSVNANVLWSEIASEMLKEYETAPFVAVYCDGKDGVRKFSLRSRKDFDCSKVAEIYGGGGHAQAAGFHTKVNE